MGCYATRDPDAVRKLPGVTQRLDHAAAAYDWPQMHDLQTQLMGRDPGGFFGWAYPPLFFLIAFALKRFYVRLGGDNPFALVMKRVVVLTVFVAIVNSYGMDWTIIEAVPFVVAIYLYKYFFRSRRLPLLQRQPPWNDLDASSGVRCAI